MKINIVFIIMIFAGLMFAFASDESNQEWGDITTIKNPVPGQRFSGDEHDLTKFDHHYVKPDIDFSEIPLYFITNKGQVNQEARFYAKASRYTL